MTNRFFVPTVNNENSAPALRRCCTSTNQSRARTTAGGRATGMESRFPANPLREWRVSERLAVHALVSKRLSLVATCRQSRTSAAGNGKYGIERPQRVGFVGCSSLAINRSCCVGARGPMKVHFMPLPRTATKAETSSSLWEGIFSGGPLSLMADTID